MHWLGTVLALVAIVYFVLKFRGQILDALPLVAANGNWVVLSVLAGCVPLQMLCAAFAWRSLLIFLQVDISRRSATSIVYLSQFARYLPGNVGHHVGKVVLLRMQGVGLKSGAASIFLETIVVLFFGLLVSVAFLPVESIEFLLEYVSYWWLLAVVLFIGLMLGVFLFRKHLKTCIDLFAGYWQSVDLQSQWWRLLEIAFCYLLNFFFIGALAWLIGKCIFGVNTVGLLEFTGIMSLAWTVGFLAPGAPAGLGVREVICLVLLAGSFSDDVTLGIIVLHRLVLSAGDLLTFIIGLMVRSPRMSMRGTNT